VTRREVSTRIFESNDTGACLRVFDSNVPDFFHISERGEFETFLHDLPGPYLVLEADAEIVGCGGHAIRGDGRTADLCWGMIRRDLHGQGLGRHLTLARLEVATRDERVGAVALSTSQHTVRFYEKLGFGVLEVSPDGFGPGLDRIDMRRDLGRVG
jgi:ribosomal protein S18 acetylase RimI-like enzyme